MKRISSIPTLWSCPVALAADDLVTIEGGDATDGNDSHQVIVESSNQNSDQYSNQVDKDNHTFGSYKKGTTSDSYGSTGSDQTIGSGAVFDGPINSGKVDIR